VKAFLQKNNFKKEKTMPIYRYHCLDCGSWDQRVAGLDDDMAVCTNCGGLVLRVADHVMGPYFEEISDLLKEMTTEASLKIGGNHGAAKRGDRKDQHGTFSNLSQDVRERSKF
jgi:putative FmdB family regulatory protein